MSRYIPNALRKIVAERAGHCCEYCKLREEDAFFAFEIDHIVSLKHGGETIPENLALSCFACNNYKGSDIGTVLLPERKFVRLFDPRIDIWEKHFTVQDGEIIALSEIARATAKVLKFNATDRIIERRAL